ncbi:GMC family oxidoreductase [Bradyrhizobium japonicum]|uniref:GMC family oxidoreductase n=1 Tax=Bradyrhizobium japonicum TaxID=375 RepID=UPI0003F97ECC|nr:GMC family oxidoreductase [Bradyrhizobium japonicum]WLB86898.1 GMC family oxidoreductase [Bradyrhizobium japonicum USDA 135]
MADEDVDVAIVGSGFAGALIANELAKQGKRVVILEAGDGIPPNINEYMQRFYGAEDKVPESPYTPSLLNSRGHFDEKINDPRKVRAGRPTVRTLDSHWKDGAKNYLVQDGELPFGSTYDRVAGGTSHWLGTCLRLVPNDFKMKTLYGQAERSFVDWPIGYDDLVDWYGKAEAELGVSADIEDQKYLGIYFPDGYQYPMPRIPNSLTDRAIGKALANIDPAKTAFLGMKSAPTEIPVRGVPAARNSQPYRNRRACAGNSNCIPICPIQAKYDPTITLNEALNHKNVRMLRHTVVRKIILDSNDVRRVSEIRITHYRPGTDETFTTTIKAKIFVVAGNAIETARLLLMSEDQRLESPKNPTKIVANGSGMVGRHLMDHPYYVAWGQLKMTADQLWPYRGPLITSGIGDLCDGPFRDRRAAFRVDIGNEGWNFVMAATGVANSDPHATSVDFINGVNRTGLNPDRAGRDKPGLALFGPELTKALNDNITRQFRVGFLVEQTPDSNNRVTLANETDGLGLQRPKITYNLSDYTKAGILAAHQMKDLLFKQMDAIDFTRIGENDPTKFDFRGTTLNYMGAGHIMGTYRMGFNKGDSVVDSFQCSHDHDNLYLVGSGTFPTGATANPTLTIAALALRTADRIAKRV